METAGLTIGILALASLFKDCVDLLSCISAAKSIGSDCAILNTMLDLEKTLLLQWAERVGLFNHDNHHPALDEEAISRSIVSVLTAIQALLAHGEEMRSRYSLRPASEEEVPDHTGVLSHPRMAALERSCRTMVFSQSVPGSNHQQPQQFSPLKRLRWVAKDKGKFESLLHQLSYFTSKLNQLIPHEGGDASLTLTCDDLGTIKHLNLGRLKLLVAASRNRQQLSSVLQSAEQAIAEDCQRQVLEALWFPTMDLRRAQVSKSHEKTFQWILKPAESGVNSKWDDLCQWLESGTGIYWVSGKAGSGKSTLMKYLYQHSVTAALLKTWSGDKKLTIPSFFFTSIGTAEQKSQEGLLKALLYRILESEPSLTARLFPTIWRKAQRSEAMPEALTPALTELKDAMEALSQVSTHSHMFCVFVDGLDEYEGRHEDTIKLLVKITKDPNIKIVVSSRPIASCVAAFSKYPKLQLHELTQADIEIYVTDRIGTHPFLEQLHLGVPGNDVTLQGIVRDITSKAAGVFLWVVLACRSVLEGFESYDHPDDIQRRIDELPPEVEDLFRHMLRQIPPRYRLQGAKLLRLCYESRLTTNSSALSTAALAIVDDGQLHTAQMVADESSHGFKRMRALLESSEATLTQCCAALEGRLRSRCWGLLELKKAAERPKRCDGQIPWLCQYGGCDLLSSTVDFIHSTLFEFLDNDETWDMECLRIDDREFNSLVTLAHMSFLVEFLIGTPLVPGYRGRFEYDERHPFIAFCIRADTAAPPELVSPIVLQVDRLLELENDSPYKKVLGRVGLEKLQFFLSGLEDHQRPNYPLAFLFAIEAGMMNFVSSYCADKDLRFFPLDRPLLCHVLHRTIIRLLLPRKSLHVICDISVASLCFLLDSGQFDPNETHKPCEKSCEDNYPILWDIEVEGSPWKEWVLNILMEKNFESLSLMDGGLGETLATGTQAFLQAGADWKAVSNWTGCSLEYIVTGVLGIGRPRLPHSRHHPAWKRMADMGRQLVADLKERSTECST